MSKSSDAVKKWRDTTKIRIVESMGGSCVCCGYDKCYRALDLHHIDPSKKDMGLGSIRASIKNWNIIVDELRKCVLICNRCHQEVHDGITSLPNEFPTFNEDYADYKKLKSLGSFDECPICKKLKPIHNITCSKQCAAKKSNKVDWDNVDILELLKIYKSYSKVGQFLGVSDVAVKKRAKKLKLI